MRGCIARVAVFLFAISTPLLSPAITAAAGLADIPVGIVAVPNAPVTLTKCKVNDMNVGIGNAAYINLTNRTTHGLLGVSVQIRYFDTDGTQIGQAVGTHRFDSSDGPVASGDSTIITINPGASLSEGKSAIAKITCRVQEALFTSLKHWTYGQAWPEKLLPLAPPPQSNVPGGSSEQNPLVAAAMQQQQIRSPKFSLSITNAWNDTLGNATLVHVALTVQGTTSDAKLTPSMLTLTMRLANGASKDYSGMPNPAPTYQKLNPLGSQTTTAYEVDPKVDLGRLGSIIVPANAAVPVVVTFLVPDVLANPTDNRQVGLR